MEMSNAVHTTNINTVYDSPYFNSLPIIERKASLDEYTVKSGQEIYELLKEDIALPIGEVYPSSMIEDDILDAISSMFGYGIKEMHESSLTDDEGTFKIYTLLLDIEERNYSNLLNQEWELSKSLGLYEKNIILRFV